jgi:hypothetical protein
MRPSGLVDGNDDDMIAGAQHDDEEAQLLREQFDFEDSTTLPRSSILRRHGICLRLEGPQPPQQHVIRPFFAYFQRAPLRFLTRKFPGKTSKVILLATCLLLWSFIFSLLLRAELPVLDGDGRNVVNLDCVDTLWRPKNECGLDGIDCRPFSNDSFAFRCPAKCASVQLLNPHAVGPIDANYRPLLVGDGTYRGDSFVCTAALHQGIISDSAGGCGRLTRIQDHASFPSVSRYGIESMSFDSYFPLSFSVTEDTTFPCPKDPRRALLLVSLFFTSVFSIFSTAPAQFFPIFLIIFAQVSFASDPPTASYRNISVLPDHISMFAKRILPALFCAVIIYWKVVKRTLSGLEAQYEKTILWLGGFWFGALSNYTFDWIPISRLTEHDLNQQPGAKLALAIILVVLVAIFAQQVYSFWLEGRLIPYLGLYALFIFGILFCLTIPGVSFRLHHYVLALLLLPGTSMQTRPSLLYQGILLGLFVNGIARWDFDSILQTADALRADGAFDSMVPVLANPVIRQEEGEILAAFSWADPPVGMHGISVLVNDVERHRAFFTDKKAQSFEWTRTADLQFPEYFRFGYIKDGRALDYTKPGALYANGTWSMSEQGVN